MRFRQNIPVAGEEQATPRTIVGVGDSIMAGGHGGVTSPFFNLYATNTKVQCNAINLGVGGSRIANVRNLDTKVLEIVRKPLYTGGKVIVVIHVGTNDLGDGTSAATVLAGLYEYAALLKTNGARVVIDTILPRQDALEATYGINASRAVINAALRTTVGTRFHGLVDFDTSANMGQDASPNSLTYYDAGKIHPTQVGHNELELFLRSVVDSL